MLIFASLLHASAALPLALDPSQSQSELFCTALNDRASHISCQAAAAPVALSAPDNSDVSACSYGPEATPGSPGCTVLYIPVVATGIHACNLAAETLVRWAGPGH